MRREKSVRGEESVCGEKPMCREQSMCCKESLRGGQPVRRAEPACRKESLQSLCGEKSVQPVRRKSLRSLRRACGELFDGLRRAAPSGGSRQSLRGEKPVRGKKSLQPLCREKPVQPVQPVRGEESLCG